MQLITNKQTDWSYVIGPYKKPVASIKSGEVFKIETLDLLALERIKGVLNDMLISGFFINAFHNKKIFSLFFSD